MAHATLPHTLTANTLAQASQVMANLQAIVTQVNGNLDATNLKDGAVTEGKLGAAAVNTTALADGAVTNDKMSADSVDTAQVKDAAITNAKMATGSVDTGQLVDDAVTNAKLADAAVDTAQVKNLAITSDKLASGAAAGNLDAGDITTTHLADDSVTEDKLESSQRLGQLSDVTASSVPVGGIALIQTNTPTAGNTTTNPNRAWLLFPTDPVVQIRSSTGLTGTFKIIAALSELPSSGSNRFICLAQRTS